MNKNSNVYLLIYLITILVLIYAINYVSYHSCNVKKENFNGTSGYSWQNFDQQDYPGNDLTGLNQVSSVSECENLCVSNEKCNAIVTNGNGTNCWLKSSLGTSVPNQDRMTKKIFRPVSTNNTISSVDTGDNYILYGIGTNNALYTQNIVNGRPEKWTQIPSTEMFIDICSDNVGGYVGINKQNQIIYTSNINNSWKPVQKNLLNVAYITKTMNGPYLASDTNYKISILGGPGNIYDTIAQNSVNWSFYDVTKPMGKVIQLQDGSFAGIGSDNFLYIRKTFNNQDPWTLQNNTVSIISIAQTPKGLLLAVGKDYMIYEAEQGLNTKWIPWGQNSCCILSIAVVKNNVSTEMTEHVNVQEPKISTVTLYENCSYTGKTKTLNVGEISYIGDDFDKITSSIKIGPYTNITIYSGKTYTENSLTINNTAGSVMSIPCLTSNNFDNMLSSIKIQSSITKANYKLDNTVSPVTIVGAWNVEPWKNNSNFIDKSAKWIWNGTKTISTVPTKFQMILSVTSVTSVFVTVHVIADNVVQGANTLKINKKIVGQIIENGWLNNNYSKISTTVEPGTNLLEFNVTNITGNAGLLVSVIDDNNNVLGRSGSGTWGWVNPLLTEDSGIEGQQGVQVEQKNTVKPAITWTNVKQVHNVMRGGIFKLRVELPNMPAYVKGRTFVPNTPNNYFYLSIEKLDPNCQIKNSSNKCQQIYVDNNKCLNKSLGNVSQHNSWRMVLVSSIYASDPSVPIGKNTDFTVITIGDKSYLKNVQTGYMPKLFVNDNLQHVYGYMDANYLSNVGKLTSANNTLCGSSVVPEQNPSVETKTEGVLEKSTHYAKKAFNATSEITNKAINGIFGKGTVATGTKPNQKFVNCHSNSDGSTYLMTTTNIAESNPINFVLNKDNSVTLRLQQFNTYGNLDKSFSLVFCNFNIQTFAFIEKISNSIGTFLINLVCFDSDSNRSLPSNTLNFSVEVSKYSEDYLKNVNVVSLNN